LIKHESLVNFEDELPAIAIGADRQIRAQEDTKKDSNDLLEMDWITDGTLEIIRTPEQLDKLAVS